MTLASNSPANHSGFAEPATTARQPQTPVKPLQSNQALAPTLLRLPDLDPIEAPKSVSQPSDHGDSAQAVDPLGTTTASTLSTRSLVSSDSQVQVEETSDSTAKMHPDWDVKSSAIDSISSTDKGRDSGSMSADGDDAGPTLLDRFASRKTLLVLLAAVAAYAIFAPRTTTVEGEPEELVEAGTNTQADPAAFAQSMQPAKSNSPDALEAIIDPGQLEPARNNSFPLADSNTKSGSAESGVVPTQSKGGIAFTPSGDRNNRPEVVTNSDVALSSPSQANAAPVSVPAASQNSAQPKSGIGIAVAGNTSQTPNGQQPGFDASSSGTSPVPSSFVGADIATEFPGDLELDLAAMDAADATRSQSQASPNVMTETAQPVLVPTQTPNPITNLLQYLPSPSGSVTANSPTSLNGPATTEPSAFRTTNAPAAPDFRFALPGVPAAPSSPAVAPASAQPEARVAMPAIPPASTSLR